MIRSRSLTWSLIPLLVSLGLSCGTQQLLPTDPVELMTTLSALAAFGPKHVGSDEGRAAAAYIRDRMKSIGLSDLREESFSFPRWQSTSSSMSLTVDGQAMSPGFDVFESSGPGHADADVVWASTATDSDLAGLALTGKVALVVRDPSFHRAAQYKNVIGKGAAAMLYLSISPSNLRQVGSVRFDWESAGTIPAITIGAVDGAILSAAVKAGKSVRATIDVAVSSTPSVGANIVGTIPGERPEQIVIGAHYDTWFAGSTDNGGGVAELLALAARRMKQAKPRYTLVFVAYDGEEVALYGGYDFLRKHRVLANDPILAVLNFESPSATDAQLSGLAHSNQPALDAALQAGRLNLIYAVYIGLEAVAGFFGGIIPTDIQGTYRSGVPTVSTAVSGPYYHTTEDTPDKVDLALLAASTDGFDLALTAMMADEPAAFAVADPQVWTAELATSGSDPITLTATVHDGKGVMQGGVSARVSVLVDDFTLAGTYTATSDASGKLNVQIPKGVATMGAGKRYLHLAAGPTYPLVEKIIALP